MGMTTIKLMTRRAWLVLTLVAGVVQAQPALPFDSWAEAFAADWVRQSAEFATFTQYFGGQPEQAALDRRLTPQTPEQRWLRRALTHQGLAQLAVYDAALLAPAQQVDAAVLQWSLQRAVAAEPYQDHYFVFPQIGGPHLQLVSLLTVTQPLQRPADIGAYLERLSQVAARLDESMLRARAAAQRGLLPPRFIAERTRGQVEAFLAPAAAENEFVSALVRRSERIEGLAADERQSAIHSATQLVEEQVRPAYTRLLALLDELLPRTTDDAGLWRLPDGAAAYAQALAANTTTTLSADAIHAIGLREVARIETEMNRVLTDALGRGEGSVAARMAALRSEVQPPADPDPRPALIERYAGFVRDAQRRSQALFNLQPAAPVEVRRVPALTERTASAYYTGPAPDGARPGVFWVPLPGPTFNMLGMRSLAVHEAVPGHHFQIALQQEQNGLPRWRQRRIFGGGSAFSEGWALYAERLAIDNGWYEGDPQALLGALDAQLFRARRLVVDTGLHSKRWTRQQAIDYGISTSEVERYVANPGQACAYMVGMLRLLELRDLASAELGARFVLKDFHDVVLQTGSVPLDVLADVLQRWVQDRRAKGG